ncbi:MAG: DEAD/DEAH box helicase [Chloroflexota bacterium]
MALEQVLSSLRADFGFMEGVTTWRTLPARGGSLVPIPQLLHPALHQELKQQGIEQLYSHQAQAVSHALQGQNLVIVTPTASGKTLCYNLPVVHALLTNPDARALYLFPTKALAQDQLANLQSFVANLQSPSLTLQNINTYDGDTLSARRTTIRRQSRIILTNPDMLHTGILPYHPNWHEFFGNLRYVVIDELHTYRGIFGSHVANVMRRLQRLCHHYGSTPQFICTSATIANPKILAERLIEKPFTLINENGAPSGEKQIILYNPPCYDPERGLRRAATLEAQELAARMVLGDIQTILFGRSRLATEIMLTYLRDRIQRSPSIHSSTPPSPQSPATSPQQPQSTIRGYRGGYLPNERREIEAGLRSGEVQAVVATNALELGIDIGALQAAILCGYPGSIAGTWQQMGRSGRTMQMSLALLVATSGVLDQYIVQHPEFIFEQPPEFANINPNNLMLLVEHLRCAAFELPFAAGDAFGQCEFVDDALGLLTEQGELSEASGRYFWNGESYPARQVSLRNSSNETVVIQVSAESSNSYLSPAPSEKGRTIEPSSAEERSGGTHQINVIGEMDRQSALLLLYEGAIYIHEGRTYRVDRLDLENLEAWVRPVNVDYYTDVKSEAETVVLAEHGQKLAEGAQIRFGDVEITSQVVSYRRVKRYTHENLGVSPLDYPPTRWETTAYWFNLTDEALERLIEHGLWRDSPNDYGPNWQAQRKRVRHRDGYCCTRCRSPEPKGREHDVHHIIPFRTFGYVPGLNECYQEANQLSNLSLLCRRCHQTVEAGVRVRGGLDGLAYTLQNLAPLHLMCDRSDIGVTFERGDEKGTSRRNQQEQNQPEQNQQPTIYIYEQAVAGLGFSERLFEIHDELLRGAYNLVRSCRCTHGCPSCIGPILDNAIAILETKELTLALLEGLMGIEIASLERSGSPYSYLNDVSF